LYKNHATFFTSRYAAFLLLAPLFCSSFCVTRTDVGVMLLSCFAPAGVSMPQHKTLAPQKEGRARENNVLYSQTNVILMSG
jgi:hypothetical protein